MADVTLLANDLGRFLLGLGVEDVVLTGNTARVDCKAADDGQERSDCGSNPLFVRRRFAMSSIDASIPSQVFGWK